ncbi:MAG: thiamine phosphate synthase [Deltaproteobacteria bacterium]|nr:thiamine phosphate synthase [Deltaproteobacteria bacterium]
MKHAPDVSLYLVTDSRLSLGRPVAEVVRAAAQNGVTIVQLREKDCSTRDFIALARRVREILAPLGIPLIINDRLDVALATGADGVHIGQSDMPYGNARRLLGEDAIIGLSVGTPEEARMAEMLDVDYLGVSPVFSTPTKTDTGDAWEIEGLKILRTRSRHRLVAIGGINQTNAATVMAAGADGIAVVSAICAADDPGKAARQLRAIVEKSRRRKILKGCQKKAS